MAKVTAPLPPPKTWIDALPFNLVTENKQVPTENHLESIFGEGPWRDVIRAIYESSDAVEAAKFAIENWQEEASPGVSIIEWLKGLANELKDPDALPAYIKEKYGQPILKVATSYKIIFTANQLHHVATFLLKKRMEFDPAVKVFRTYDDKRGIWKVVANEEVIRRIMEFTVPSMVESPMHYKSTNSYYKSLFENAKSIGLKETTLRPYTLIGAANGVIAVGEKKPELTKFSPVYKLTHAVPASYDNTKTFPTKFVEFLDSILEDREDRELLQLWCGMALVGKNPFHKILVIAGEAGAGKSTLITLIEKMVGTENVGTLMTSRLEDRFELSEFFGKTLLTAKDASADFLSGKSAHMLKTLSGDTGIKAEVKFAQQRVTLEGPFNILIGCNSELLVALRDDAAAWKRRLLLLRIKRKAGTTKGKPKQIHLFEDKLIRDEGSAILNWMLQGAKEIRSLQRSESSFPLTTRQEAIRDSVLFRSDSISAFIKSELSKGTSTDEIKSVDLFERYMGYCERCDLIAEEEKRFFRRIGAPLFRAFQANRETTRTRPPAKCYRGVKFT